MLKTTAPLTPARPPWTKVNKNEPGTDGGGSVGGGSVGGGRINDKMIGLMTRW